MSGTIALRTVARSVRFEQHPKLTACWIWTGSVDSKGIGIAFVGGETWTARRAVYRRYRGEPPGNLGVRCRRKLCVNPHHTEVKAAKP